MFKRLIIELSKPFCDCATLSDNWSWYYSESPTRGLVLYCPACRTKEFFPEPSLLAVIDYPLSSQPEPPENPFNRKISGNN